MKKFLLIALCTCIGITGNAQRLLSWAPEFPIDNSNLTVTVDCTKGNQGLFNYGGGTSSDVYVHVGVITNLSTGPSDWKYVKFTWGTTDAAAHATSIGANKYQYVINNIRTFFGVPAGETIKKVTIIFRSGDGSKKQVNSDVSDMYLPVYGNTEFAVRLNLPPFEPRYIPWAEPLSLAVGGNVSISGVSSANSALTLKLDGTTITTAAAANVITATPTITTACEHKIMLEGNDGSGIKKDSFSFYINPTTNVAALPAGMVEGINYAANNTSVTLVLYAPNKTSATVIGDFSNWATLCANQMNRTPDGNYYWITLNGLTSGTEYGYQYVVDNTIKIADPYAQKILDPNNDQYIDVITYPNLKPYPTGLTTDLVSVFQTAEPQYTWLSGSFVRPDKKNLMTYELLIRDFTAQHSYQSLIDSFQYFKNLGINAIELMPINEFDGNESWGYNPAFYFAPDKYYGTKNKLKEFIDKCHLNGIAVILDVVYNHCTGAAPQAKLYWDAANNRPAANNPWLNISAPHPYSVFNDFNHTSTATQYLVQRSIDHWLNEYRVDGFRFDLAKGFTQTVSTTTTVENYDATRVANLNRYYNGTIVNHPGTYMILEFLGSLPCQEEQEYATKGFMLWGNNNYVYNQCTMGYVSNSDISPIVYSDPKKAFSNPAEMGYMESHDEERTMYRNITSGNVSGSYNVKTLATALAREEAAATVFFTVPGPKMIWQFEERGYDISLSFGGSNLANKPPHWEYMTDPNRKHLYDTYSSIIQLRLNNPAIFNNTSFTYDFYNAGGLVKVFQIADPLSTGKKITVVANLDVIAQTKSVTFQSTGDWTNYISNGTGTGINGTTAANFTLTNATQSIVLQPGEYHIYISIPPCATPAPTATTPVSYCQNATATALTATGTSLLWYTTATGGTGSATAPTPSTTTIGSTTYYVSQTTGCESPRFAIVVNITATTPAPTVTTPVNYCQNATATALTATGTGLLWYAAATGGTGSSTAPTPSTTTIGNTTYYVSQTLSCGEGPRVAIIVNVNAIPGAPSVASPVTYCQNTTAVALTATGTNLLWYTVASGGTGTATAPIPSTTSAGSTTYYVSQTTTGCESPRASITVTINATPSAPAVTAAVNYCQNATATALTATGSNLLWYTVATGGTGTATAPTPSTATAGSTNYYVSQTSTACESPRALITVNITALPAAPVVSSPVTYCQNVTAVPLTATGTGLLWYTVATGGTGTATAPTPPTNTAGTVTYYVSQSNGCGASARASINVVVNSTPVASGLNTAAVSMNAATISWSVTSGVYYTVEYKAASSSTWINAGSNITTGTVTLTNLLASTTYDWRVSANCTATSITNYTTAQFTTSAFNSTITNLKNGIGIKISPDPLIGKAIIDYIVPESGTVNMVLTDVFGQRITVLYQGSQNAGQYQLILNNQLSGLVAGCYFIRIQQNDKSYFTRFIKK
ncbi:MAG: alpha-amylase family glycosyl hydrolase [Ferruginibacter sp.]